MTNRTREEKRTVTTDLAQYYRHTGISAEAFRCSMESHCRAVCSDFISAREAFVGSAYEAGTLPRILFISADPAKDLSGRDPARRAMPLIRRSEESSSRPAQGSADFRKSDHWYQTHKFAHELLAPVANAHGLSEFDFPSVHKYFAHTNSAKCKDAAQGTTQGQASLFKNCRQFIPGEVASLRPDVIVTQGVHARDSVAGAFTVLQRSLSPSSQHYIEVIEVASRPVLKFSMAHPKARGGLYQREVRDAWAWYMQVGHRFLLDGLRILAELDFCEV